MRSSPWCLCCGGPVTGSQRNCTRCQYFGLDEYHEMLLVAVRKELGLLPRQAPLDELVHRNRPFDETPISAEISASTLWASPKDRHSAARPAGHRRGLNQGGKHVDSPPYNPSSQSRSAMTHR